MSHLAGNADKAQTTASTTTHMQGRLSSAKLPIEWLCKGWHPLHMCVGTRSGWGLCIRRQVNQYTVHQSQVPSLPVLRVPGHTSETRALSQVYLPTKQSWIKTSQARKTLKFSSVIKDNRHDSSLAACLLASCPSNMGSTSQGICSDCYTAMLLH